MPEKWVLRQYQSLPLRAKIGMTESRIIEWYDHFDGQVCVSFSGGKDSTVLAHLVHEYYPDVPLVFANTGLEYPEIQAFARKMGAVFVRPKMSFSEVISKYGYPIISKENAEAIYYARRIRNKTDRSLIGGGGATTDRKRNEFNGLRTRFATRNDGMETGKPDEHAPGYEENRLRSESGGVQRKQKLMECQRRRDQISGESMTNGGTGEENPLPG